MKYRAEVYVTLDLNEDRALIERIVRVKPSRLAHAAGVPTSTMHHWINGTRGLAQDTVSRILATLMGMGPWESADPRYQDKHEWHQRRLEQTD